jgi:hypothetical protein
VDIIHSVFWLSVSGIVHELDTTVNIAPSVISNLSFKLAVPFYRDLVPIFPGPVIVIAIDIRYMEVPQELPVGPQLNEKLASET